MAITLGGVSLPDLIWDDNTDWSGIVASSEMTLGGLPVIWEDTAAAGRPIDLVATRDQGWLTRAQVVALSALRATRGWKGTLNYEGDTYRVRFRNEDPPAIDVRPIVDRVEYDDTDYYRGRIKLMVV